MLDLTELKMDLQDIINDLEVIVLNNEDDLDRGKGKYIIRDYIKELEEKLVKANSVLGDVSNCPSELEPVLAKIEHINSLGKSSWYEVVYFDGNWRCYAGSRTFKDGEKVIEWRYCKDCC